MAYVIVYHSPHDGWVNQYLQSKKNTTPRPRRVAAIQNTIRELREHSCVARPFQSCPIQICQSFQKPATNTLRTWV